MKVIDRLNCNKQWTCWEICPDLKNLDDSQPGSKDLIETMQEGLTH